MPGSSPLSARNPFCARRSPTPIAKSSSPRVWASLGRRAHDPGQRGAWRGINKRHSVVAVAFGDSPPCSARRGTMIRRFARPYARAILDVAGSPAAAQDVRSQLQRFEAARRGSADLNDLYANPGIDHAVKVKVTNAITARLGLSELALKVLGLLIRNQRIHDLVAILEALGEDIRHATN